MSGLPKSFGGHGFSYEQKRIDHKIVSLFQKVNPKIEIGADCGAQGTELFEAYLILG